MANIHDFDEIRPYINEEVPEVMKRIVRERGFLNFIKTFFPEHSTKTIIEKLLKINNIAEFQRNWVYPLVHRIIQKTINKLTVSGLSNLDNSQNYLFISNHRDIVLDSALLQYIIVNQGFNTTQIAIGSNLLILDWIIDLVKLNRTFIVKRDVPQKELYHYSVNLSKYIRFVITEENDSIWLAQREGRTKKGDDKTQISLLKMLNLSGEKDFFENFEELNILPLSISYEYEPMVVAKVQELYNREINPEYKKTKLEDLNSMDGGIENYKGNVHYGFGTPLKDLLHKIKDIKRRKERFEALAKLIDNEIYKNYKLTPFNYIASDILFGTNHELYYTKEDKERFLEHFNDAIKQFQGNIEQMKKMFIEIYAMPVKNYENLTWE